MLLMTIVILLAVTPAQKTHATSVGKCTQEAPESEASMGIADKRHDVFSFVMRFWLPILRQQPDHLICVGSELDSDPISLSNRVTSGYGPKSYFSSLLQFERYGHKMSAILDRMTISV